MNWRALGCGLLAIVVFVAIGISGTLMALEPAGCPAQLQWVDRTYVAVGPPTDEPVVGSGDPAPLGTTLIGVAGRTVFGPEGSTPSPNGGNRPDEIALDCGDGTFVTYRWTAAE